ncbi:hypothetical protein QBC37DRAFT_421446 [Rhypophila decipiens]|uniref:FAD-binding domain-containing protein n=1 Tax=Rhypophila decipiens TaxID=261697 RepID=A0AAN6Y923_9PEZI|nr:hypothetical protein QBC37DRAFT_421446 [Rhypophila decipiens]
MQANHRLPVPQDDEALLRIAIVGGGIVGVSLTLGLLRLPNIQVKLYEQASTLREIGAGVAFTTNAQRCMELLSPDVIASMRAVSTKNEDPYYTYVDGYHSPEVPEGQKKSKHDDMKETQLFRLFAGNTGFDACHRAHFLDEMVKHLPESVVQFRKRLVMYEKRGDEYVLRFEDGSLDTADAIIGCDGIKSRVRQVLLGVDNPASYPGFTHQVAFRGLIRMGRAVEVLGKDKAHNQCMHMGPGAHMLNFPVAQHTLMNVVAFGAQAEEWTHEKMVAPASREEVLEIFRGWCPAVTAIAGLLGEVLDEDGVSTRASLDKWAIFDTYDNPAPTYADGCVCIAGDAAHATSPHHGAGAGMGIEDGLALATVFEQAIKTLHGQPEVRGTSKSEVVSAAFAAYNRVRRDRTQWLVRSSREVSRTYEWANPDCGMDPEKCLKDIEWRAHKIWYFDIDGMIKELASSYRHFLSLGSSPFRGTEQQANDFIKLL